jgi:uncharacterized protein
MLQLKRALLKAAALLLLGYLAICALLYVNQRNMIYFPQPRHFSFADDLALPKSDGQIRISTQARPGSKALIYFGGNAEDVSYNLTEFVNQFPNHAIYLPHYPGYGHNSLGIGGTSGAPSESGIFADALHVFDHISQQHTEVLLVGRSLGSGAASYVASRREIARLVLITPFDSIGRIAAQRFSIMPISLILQDRFESWRYAPLISAPTLIIASEFDAIVPRAHTEALIAAFKPDIISAKVLRGVDHGSISAHPEYFVGWTSAAL